MMKPSPQAIREQVAIALREDIGTGDLTAGLISASSRAEGHIVAREEAVFCGRDWAAEVFHQVDPAIHIQWSVADGDALAANQVVCRLEGPTRALLSAERTALNYLQTLSSTATRAAQYVAAVAGTGARILDTRKTIPGLRLAQKYAVSCGGAANHRVGLFDAILIKENHIAAAGSVSAALAAASRIAGVPVEIEVETLDQLREALAAGASRVLLDNFDNGQLQEAVRLNAGRARLEASGGVNLSTVREIAETGVDDISVGELTKDIRAVDLSMRLDQASSSSSAPSM